VLVGSGKLPRRPREVSSEPIVSGAARLPSRRRERRKQKESNVPTEVRIYTMKPGKLDDFVEIFKNDIMPTSAAYGVRIHAGWVHPEKNEFVWVRSYDDEETLERYSNSPERAVYTPKTQLCVDTMDVRNVESILGDLPALNS
jgi:quinol monooxygenase YgiN